MKKLILSVFISCFVFSVFAENNSVIMLRDSGPLREDKGNGGVEWALEIPAGTTLALEDDDVVSLTLITSKEKTENVKFYKVNYNNKTYYASENEVAKVASGKKACVILKDTAIFSNPSISTFRNARLEQASIVVAGKTEDVAGIKFTEVKYWSADSWTVRTRYVFAETVSKNENDLKGVQIVDKVQTLKDEEMQKALITSAEDLDTSSEIHEYIHSVYSQVTGMFNEDDYDSFDGIGAISVKDGSKINLRQIPSVKGIVSAQLEDGTQIAVSMRSKFTETIDGITAYWYYVNTEDKAGWVFGGYLNVIELEP